MSDTTQKAKGPEDKPEAPKLFGPSEMPASAIANLPVLENYAHKPSPLPKFADERFQYFAVRLQGDAGYWPALPFELDTLLCNPDPHRSRLYPRGRSGERFPGNKYETPDRNAVVHVQLEGGQSVVMYLADAFAHDLVILQEVTEKRRAWRRVDSSDIVYFEDPHAAANGQWQPVVQVVGWCPLKGPDDNGYPTDHGRIWSKGEKVEGRADLIGTGECLKCTTRSLKVEALKKINDLRGSTLEIIQ